MSLSILEEDMESIISYNFVCWEKPTVKENKNKSVDVHFIISICLNKKTDTMVSVLFVQLEKITSSKYFL